MDEENEEPVVSEAERCHQVRRSYRVTAAKVQARKNKVKAGAVNKEPAAADE